MSQLRMSRAHEMKAASTWLVQEGLCYSLKEAVKRVQRGQVYFDGVQCRILTSYAKPKIIEFKD